MTARIARSLNSPAAKDDPALALLVVRAVDPPSRAGAAEVSRDHPPPPEARSPADLGDLARCPANERRTSAERSAPGRLRPRHPTAAQNCKLWEHHLGYSQFPPWPSAATRSLPSTRQVLCSSGRVTGPRCFGGIQDPR